MNPILESVTTNFTKSLTLNQSLPSVSTVDVNAEASLWHQPLTWTPKPLLGVNHWRGHWSLPLASTVDVDTKASHGRQPLTWTLKPPFSVNRWCGHKSLPWASTIDVDTEASLSASTVDVDTKASLQHQPVLSAIFPLPHPPWVVWCVGAPFVKSYMKDKPSPGNHWSLCREPASESRQPVTVAREPSPGIPKVSPGNKEPSPANQRTKPRQLGTFTQSLRNL